MGNRSALILSASTPPATDQTLSFAFEGNNFVPLFWFAAFPAEAVEGWEAVWHAHLAAMERQEGYPDTTLWTPWPEARERLAALAAYLNQMHRKPGWAPLFHNWHNALLTLAEARQAQWLGMELREIFAFHEDPAAMVSDTLAGIGLWQGIPELPTPEHPRELSGDPSDSITATYFSAEPEPPARAGFRFRRLKLNDWLMIPAMAVIVLGVWIYTQSLALTALALAVVAFGFYRHVKS